MEYQEVERYAQYLGYKYTNIYSKFKHVVDSDDFKQEALLMWHKYKIVGYEWKNLKIIMDHGCKNLIKKTKKQGFTHKPASELPVMVEYNSRIDGVVEFDDTWCMRYEILEHINTTKSVKTQRILIYYLFEGLTHSEIACKFSLTRQAISHRISKWLKLHSLCYNLGVV